MYDKRDIVGKRAVYASLSGPLKRLRTHKNIINATEIVVLRFTHGVKKAFYFFLSLSRFLFKLIVTNLIL